MRRIASILFSAGVLLCAAAVLRAQYVPDAIKYQAVMRDVNGVPMADKEVDIKVSLLQNGSPVYQEVHTKQTNGYGLVHLEIGRGNKELIYANTTLNQLDWGKDPVYVQIEIQIDGTGYTNMGTGELLTVPYAYMAANVQSGGDILSGLQDGDIPRYNAAGENLAPSRIRKTPGDTLSISASYIRINNSMNLAERGYLMPTQAPDKNKVLVTGNVINGYRVLEWQSMEGGGSGTGTGGSGFDGKEADDARLLYWNHDDGEVQSADIKYNYSGDKNIEVLNGLKVDKTLNVVQNADVAGTLTANGEAVFNGALTAHAAAEFKAAVLVNENAHFVKDVTVDQTLNAQKVKTPEVEADEVKTPLVTADKVTVADLDAALDEGKIFIGNASGRSERQAVSGSVILNAGGQTRLNLGVNAGLTYKLASETATGQDSILLDARILEDDSLWVQNPADGSQIYAYAKGEDHVKVGIGLDNPQQPLHVQGNVLFSKSVESGDSVIKWMWDADKGALRIGGLHKVTLSSINNLSEWNWNKLAPHSFAFGWNAMVDNDAPFSYAFGNEASVETPHSFAIGTHATVNGEEGIAIGNYSGVGVAGKESQSRHAIAIGYSSVAVDTFSISVGAQSKVYGTNSVALGYQNEMGTSDKHIERAFSAGYKNKLTADSNAIAIGNMNVVGKAGAIAIGSSNKPGTNTIAIGHNTLSLSDEAVVVGQAEARKTANDKAYEGPVLLGHAFSGTDKVTLPKGTLAVGSANQTGTSNNVFMFGRGMQNNNNFSSICMIGSGIYSSDQLGSSGQPAFIFGMEGNVSLILDKNEDAWFPGDVYADDGSGSFIGLVAELSDRRLKQDIKPLAYSLAWLDSLAPVSYKYISDKKKQTHFGFIAQDVEKFFPQLVRTDKNGMLSLYYDGFIPVLWNYNLQLYKQVETLQNQNRELNARLQELESQLQAVKEKLGL